VPETAQRVEKPEQGIKPEDLAGEVERIVRETPVFDVHTHQYPPSFEKLFSAGIDDLVTYHYLIAELFRSSDVSIDGFWSLDNPGELI
jgi:hypothetical protein